VFGHFPQPSRRVIGNADGQRCHDDLSQGWLRTPLPLCQPNSIDPEKTGLRPLQKPQQFVAQSLSSDWMGTKSKPLAAGER